MGMTWEETAPAFLWSAMEESASCPMVMATIPALRKQRGVKMDAPRSRAERMIFFMVV